jgi:4-hydroxybenzoate polyprenyltransferase
MVALLGLPAQIKHWAIISYRMVRIRTVLLMVTFEAIGYEAVKPTKGVSIEFLLVAVMFSALYICATCFNDAADEEIDKVNLPNDVSRPLVTTKTTGRQLQILGIVALAVSAVAAIIVDPIYILFVVAGAIIDIFYSVPPIRISYRGILASFWLTLSYVAIPFWAGALISDGAIGSNLWWLFSGMYCCFISRILLKDFRDYEGDKKFGKLNFLVRHGPERTCLASAIAWLIGSAVLSLSLYDTSVVLVYIIALLSLIIFYQLYLLAHETKYTSKLYEVAIVGRMGNAIALAVLTCFTLQAFSYSDFQDNLFVVVVAVVVAATATNPGQFRQTKRMRLTHK